MLLIKEVFVLMDRAAIFKSHCAQFENCDCNTCRTVKTDARNNCAILCRNIWSENHNDECMVQAILTVEEHHAITSSCVCDTCWSADAYINSLF